MLKNDGSYDTQSKHNDESSSNIKNTTVSAINGDRFILSDESDEEGKEDKINQTLMDSSSTSEQVTKQLIQQGIQQFLDTLKK